MEQERYTDPVTEGLHRMAREVGVSVPRMVEWLQRGARPGRNSTAEFYYRNTLSEEQLVRIAKEELKEYMMPRITHTYVVLEVSKAAYDEIHAKLKAAGYDHAFHLEYGHGIVMDMQGIAIANEEWPDKEHSFPK